jgi:hypothetical protein
MSDQAGPHEVDARRRSTEALLVAALRSRAQAVTPSSLTPVAPPRPRLPRWRTRWLLPAVAALAGAAVVVVIALAVLPHPGAAPLPPTTGIPSGSLTPTPAPSTPSATPTASESRLPSSPAPVTHPVTFAGVTFQAPSGWTLVETDPSGERLVSPTFRSACVGPASVAAHFGLPGVSSATNRSSTDGNCLGGLVVVYEPSPVSPLNTTSFTGQLYPNDQCGSAHHTIEAQSTVTIDALAAAYTQALCAGIPQTLYRQWLLLDRGLGFVENQPDHAAREAAIDTLVNTATITTPKRPGQP